MSGNLDYRAEERSEVWPKRIAIVLLAAVALVYLHSLGGFGQPPHYVHDECYQAFTAHRYVRGDAQAWNPRATRADAARLGSDDMSAFTAYEWVHPPGAKLVMASLVKVFGFRAEAYRAGSVLFGLLALLGLWRLGARLRGEWFGLLALSLLACDGLLLVMSRIAMNDVYVTACIVWAVYCVYRFWTATSANGAWLLAAGGLWGCGLAMKWNALTPFVACAVLTATQTARATWRQRDWRPWVVWASAFVLLPLGTYLLAYAPYFLSGHRLGDFVDLHREMIHYHRTLNATHTYGSPWWSWPLIGRPVWFYADSAGEGVRRVIYAFGNPVLWWAFLPSLAYVSARLVRTRSPVDAVIVLGFFVQWLPWMFVSRVGFIQYLLPAVPFGVLAIAASLQDAWRVRNRPIRALVITYFALCLLAFIHFHPIWSASPVAEAQLAGRYWLWFDSWR